MAYAPNSINVVGIDLAAGRGITEVACLSLASRESIPTFDASHHLPVASDEEIVAAAASYQPSVIAIDAPLSLPAPVMRSLARLGPHASEHGCALTASLSPSMGNAQVVPSAASPYLRAAERDPIWSQLKVRPLPVSFLGGLTFRAISLLPTLRTALPGTAIIEVFPSGTARALSLRIRTHGTQGGPKRVAKSTPLVRAMLQEALSVHIAGLPVIRENDGQPLEADLLDALLAAFTAVAYVRGTFIAVGDPAEGQIILPQG